MKYKKVIDIPSEFGSKLAIEYYYQDMLMLTISKGYEGSTSLHLSLEQADKLIKNITKCADPAKKFRSTHKLVGCEWIKQKE